MYANYENRNVLHRAQEIFSRRIIGTTSSQKPINKTSTKYPINKCAPETSNFQNVLCIKPNN